MRILPLPPRWRVWVKSGGGGGAAVARRGAALDGRGRVARRDIGAQLASTLADDRRRGGAHQRLQAAHPRRLVGAGGRAGRVARSRICRPASAHAQAAEAARVPRRGGRRQFAQRGGGSERACSAMSRRSTTIYNAVDLREFSPDGAARRSRSACGAHARARRTIRVGLLATFGRWKGHETFLRAMQQVMRDGGVRAPTSSARRSTTRPAASTRWTRSATLARESGSRSTWASRDSSSGRPRHCARSTSSCTRALSRSPSGSSSPKAWRAAGR